MKYREIKSRNCVTKDFGRQVKVTVKIPANTCHPGVNVEFRSQEKPPTWNCEKCGSGLFPLLRPFHDSYSAAGLQTVRNDAQKYYDFTTVVSFFSSERALASLRNFLETN